MPSGPDKYSTSLVSHIPQLRFHVSTLCLQYDDIFLQRLKGIVHSKMKILTSFTHPHVISNLTFFLMENTNGDVSQIKITQVWVNYRIFIFGWTIPLSLCKEKCGGKNANCSFNTCICGVSTNQTPALRHWIMDLCLLINAMLTWRETLVRFVIIIGLE